MQLSRFSTGGFVLHKVTTRLNHRSHCSAWFDADGTLVDAELILRDGSTRPVKRGKGIWCELAKLGSVHAVRPVVTSPDSLQFILSPELCRAIGQLQMRELDEDWSEVFPQHFASVDEVRDWNTLRLSMLDYSRCVFE